MFVRDSNGNPREISRIFVRDAAGNPQEVSKIYVRDENGNPRLVFDNTTVVVPVLCPTCDAPIQTYLILANPDTATTARFTSATTTGCGSGIGALIPSTEINKNYWSKISIHSEILNSNEATFSNAATIPNLTAVTHNLDAVNCNLRNFPPATWTTTGPNGGAPYWSSLLTEFDSLTNYPILPGFIAVDWTTFGIRDTFYMVMKLPKTRFTKHCVEHPEFPGVYPTGCPTSGLRSTSIYPFDNKTILLRRDTTPSDSLDFKCGQEYCVGTYGRTTSTSISDCGSGWSQSTSWFEEYPGGVGNCADDGTGTGVHGSIELGQPCPCCNTCVDNLPQCPGFSPCCTGKWCDCHIFFNTETEGPTENPFSFIVAMEDHGTARTLPVVRADAEPQDCCPSTCYGPVPFPLATTENHACRTVYQIPPINSENPGAERLGFFEDIVTGLLMDSSNVGGSAASIRIILPVYVNLDNRLRGKRVKINSTKYDTFVNNGNGPSTTTERSVWNAVKGFLGVVPGTSGQFTQIVPDSERVWLSSSSFYYNEARTTSDSAPFDRVPHGLSVTTNGFPALWWTVNGYPTETSTHYIVLELDFSSTGRCMSTSSTSKQLQNLENQKFFITGIRFYPVESTCSNKYYKHPVFQSFIIPASMQNYSKEFGFVDYYAGLTQTTLTNDQGGAGNPGIWWVGDTTQSTPVIESEFWAYTNNNVVPPVTERRCLKYPGLGSYSTFLSKYYQAATAL